MSFAWSKRLPGFAGAEDADRSTPEPSSIQMSRPQRWDEPFDPQRLDRVVAHPDGHGMVAALDFLFDQPEIRDIEAHRFPNRISLTGILQNDCRILTYKPGDLVVREGDYGSSAFLVLSGSLRVILAPGLPEHMLGRQGRAHQSFLRSLSSLWTNSRIPEIRDVRRYGETGRRYGETGRRDGETGRRRVTDEGQTRIVLQDFPVILDAHRTAELGRGKIFGELAALGRIPRTATVFAATTAMVLEIRWQGLRELRRFDPGWRRRIDQNYRATALSTHLREVAMFRHLDATALDHIAQSTLFETYGTFEWSAGFKQLTGDADPIDQEPVIFSQGDYPDGLLLIRAGFARVSVRLGHGERTLTYLQANDIHGAHELYTMWKTGTVQSMQTSLRAIGYVDLLRVPASVLETYVFPTLSSPPEDLTRLAARPLIEDSLMEWKVEQRLINGTNAMVIDLDKCTRCDDCVRACAAAHGGNPRFVRHGRIHDHWMVATACMHCVDPVCMIGCPTGAIHRSPRQGTVLVNDDTCIGCGTCAESCPYNNIRLVEIRDRSGRKIMDGDTGRPILKATKCDLCDGMPGGAACQRACPHDALKRVGL